MFNSSRSGSAAATRRLTLEYKQWVLFDRERGWDKEQQRLTSKYTFIIPHTNRLSAEDSLFPACGPIDEKDLLHWEALVPGPDDSRE